MSVRVNRRGEKRAKRLERELRRREILTCHICGHQGQRKAMMVRQKQWVCRSIPGCTERVLNPMPVSTARPSLSYTLADLDAMRDGFNSYPQRFVMGGS